MDNRISRSKMAAKPKFAFGTTVDNTKMARDTSTPEENDPCWDELGATRIVNSGKTDIDSGFDINSPANYTELTPSRVLGKNLTRLGDFELRQKLGEGAMGAVYKAKQVTFNGEQLEQPRTVALKILFPHVANNPKLVKRLEREANAMFQLSHPNIVQAFAIGEAEGCQYIAMEYIAGLSTQKWLGQLGRFPVADAVRITIDCAKALAYAHSENKVHRDIKPDNILVARDGMVKVADLGMVKIDDEEMSLTQTGHAVGTPWFMPLEQAKNAKEIDGRSDIYALGCSLYAFITGNPPFTGRTIVDVIQAKEIGTFPPARQTNPDVPERLDLIIAKMANKLPKHRYQTCAELIKDLESLNLASETPTFLRKKAVEKAQEDNAVAKMNKTVSSSLIKSRLDESAEPNVPALDPHLWYVQMRNSTGSKANHTFTTQQVMAMLTDGTIQPTAKASHHATDGFRALATYKEFQSVALQKMTKKGADKNSVRTRGLFKQIEEKERQRAELQRADDEESQVSANARYWISLFLKVLPIALGIIFFFTFIASAASNWQYLGVLIGSGILLCISSVCWFIYK